MPDPEKPIKDSKYYTTKYGQYIGGGRDTDRELADMTVQYSSKPYKSIVSEAAKKLELSPEILFASLNEEGVRQMVRNREYTGDEEFPIAGYEHFGLDTFGDAYPNLVKKGYLPEDMTYQPATKINEKLQDVHSANFRNAEDAISAKAAMMRDAKDGVMDYAAKRGYNLSDESKKFFMLAAYNGGAGNARKMLDSYNAKGLLKDDAYLAKKPSSYGGIYDNVMRRMVPANAWKDDGMFAEQPEAAAPKPANIPTKTGTPMYNMGKIIAYIQPDGKIVAPD